MVIKAYECPKLHGLIDALDGSQDVFLVDSRACIVKGNNKLNRGSHKSQGEDKSSAAT